MRVGVVHRPREAGQADRTVVGSAVSFGVGTCPIRRIESDERPAPDFAVVP